MGATAPQVAAIIATVLQVERIEVDDDLYGLGCDSLQAVQIALALERHFGCGLPAEIMETSGQVTEIAAWIEAQRGSGAGPVGAR